MDTASVSLARVWTLVAGVLGALSALPGLSRGVMEGRAWGRAFAELRLAEAAARRAIFAMAAASGEALPPPPSAMPPEKDATPPPRPRKGQSGTTPFRLSDPLPDPFAALARAEGDPPPTRAEEGTEGMRLHSTAGLQARMDALAAVLADPAPALARLLKLRARPRPHIFARSAAPRLRPGNPPGYVRARWTAWEMDVLMEIHARAMEAPRAPPLVAETG